MKLAVAVVSVLALAGVASADKVGTKQRADALFKQGKKLMDDKRYADACAAFEESYKLDPTIGTQLNVAKCYEDWGKLGRAYTSYQQAEKMARETGDGRADKIKELIITLDPQVPRMTLRPPKDAPPNFTVTLDRQPVPALGKPFVVDPGPKTIEWWVGRGPKKQKIVAVERGAESEVSLDIPSETTQKRPPEGNGDNGEDGDGGDNQRDRGDKPDRPVPPGRNQRIGGIALGGAGVLAIGVSSIMTLSARSKYKDALAMYCNNMTTTCDMTGLQLTHDARSTANTATVVFLLGAAAVGGGVALYMLAPRVVDEEEPEEAARYLVPTISPDGAGIVFGGRY